MKEQIDVVCLVSVKRTGRIHPTTFVFIREEGEKLKQAGGRLSARRVGFHPEGFTEPEAAWKWLRQCKVNPAYVGPEINAEMISDMEGPYSFKTDELVPYTPAAAEAA